MSQSHLTFDPEVGLIAPDTAVIKTSVEADWKSAFFDADKPELNTEDATPAGQLITSEVAEIEAKNNQLLYFTNQFNPKVSTGRWQDALGYIYFLERKLDEPTIVTCQLTGLNGTQIPYGAIVSNTDGYNLIMNIPGGVTIGTSGEVEATFRTTETGPINIPAGSVNTIVTTIAGWDTVANANAGATGRDLESRAEFETRRYASVAKNAHGTVGAIYGALANLPDVIDVQVLENIGPFPVVKYGVTVPGHGITVCIYGGDDQDIAQVIYEKKDAGADTGGNTQITYLRPDYSNAVYTYYILRPDTINFWVKVTIADKNNITTVQEQQIRNAVYQDFLGNNRQSGNPRVGLAQDVFASRFYYAIQEIDGIEGLIKAEVYLGETLDPEGFVDYLIINGNQEPVMTPGNVSIVIEEV